jgi:hypothetical protein
MNILFKKLLNYYYLNMIYKYNTKYMLNLVLYSEGEPFNSTKKKLIETINNFTNKNVIIHEYDLNKMKQSDWYNKIKDLPNVKGGHGRRNGWYNAWKSFITQEVYNCMNNDDILYYVDCSQYFRNGFKSNVDKLCAITIKEGFIAGSVSDDIKNNSFEHCHNLNVWNKILPNNDNKILLEKKHVLNSWFILIKNDINTHFINDWAYWTTYADKDLPRPLVTYHHTVDQSIFNILVHKYKLKVFYCPDIKHNDNKDRNKVLDIINKNDDIYQYFIHL